MRTLLFVSGVLVLGGCAASTPYVKSADPCNKPVVIPAGGVSDRQVEILWSRDRRALLDCADKVETLSGRKVGER